MLKSATLSSEWLDKLLNRMIVARRRLFPTCCEGVAHHAGIPAVASGAARRGAEGRQTGISNISDESQTSRSSVQEA